jgi:hypothetical protein
MAKKDIYAGPNESPKFGRLIQTATDPQPPNWAEYPNANTYHLAYERWEIQRKRKAEKERSDG